jgi:hypothetical protein
MITVSILINGQPLYTRTAVNVSDRVERSNDQRAREGDLYELDDDTKLVHHRYGGAVLLAHKMLDTIDEVGLRNTPSLYIPHEEE